MLALPKRKTIDCKKRIKKFSGESFLEIARKFFEEKGGIMKTKTDDLMEKARLDEHHSSFSAAEKDFADEAAAARAFADLREKLLDVEQWNAHGLLSSFELFDENGRELPNQKISVGTFLRISLTGTFKYDWVRVIEIIDEPDEFIVTVKPTFDPTDETPDKTSVSHFFTGESTNNFCLVRRETRVWLYVIGLNEKMNARETDSSLETVRNAAVNLGAYLGVQRGEWEKFCHHFMNEAAGGQAA